MKTVTAAQIAREMKLNPKRVRSILRSAGYEKTREGLWVFPLSKKAEIKALVRSMRKRATISDRKPSGKSEVAATMH